MAPVTVPASVDRQIDQILKQTVDSLREEGIIYKGKLWLLVVSSVPRHTERVYSAHKQRERDIDTINRT